MKNLEENYIQKKILNVEQLSWVGKPCAQLCTWILNQINLYEYLKNWILVEQQRIVNEKELEGAFENYQKLLNRQNKRKSKTPGKVETEESDGEGTNDSLNKEASLK